MIDPETVGAAAGADALRPADGRAAASTAAPTASTTCSSTAPRSSTTGEFTDARPGTLLRSGRDTETVEVPGSAGRG